MQDREKDEYREDLAAGEPSPPPGEAAGEAPPAPGEASPGEDAAVLRNQLAYLAAEFDNYKKRMMREREALVAFGNERIIRAILPVLDNLERALSQGGQPGSADALLAGVRMTYETFLQELRKFGVEQIAAEGEPFDPAIHEAIAMVPFEGRRGGTVIEEAHKGYRLHGRLVRPAQVVVAKGAEDDAPSDPVR